MDRMAWSRGWTGVEVGKPERDCHKRPGSPRDSGRWNECDHRGEGHRGKIQGIFWWEDPLSFMMKLTWKDRYFQNNSRILA
jgi:hypothetical protein